MPASWGHRSRARAASRWRSEVLVDSGGLAISPSCPSRAASSWRPSRAGTGPAAVSEEGPVPASPYVICLDDAGRAELESVSRRGTAPFRLVLRARIVLLAADGLPNSAIAARLGVCEDTARKWRRRYCEQGLGGLADAPRPGRPRKFPARVVAEVKALACELPAAQREAAGPLDLPRAGPRGGRRRDRRRGLGVHGAPLARRRRDQALAAPVVDLPPRPVLRPQGRPRPRPVPADLGRTSRWATDEYVLSADEKPGVQARSRVHLPLPPGPRPGDARRERVRPLRHPGLPGRLRRPPRHGSSAGASRPPG